MENLGVRSKCISENLRGFYPRIFGMVQNGKLGVEKPGENILRGFQDFRELSVFDLTESFSKPSRYSPIFLKNIFLNLSNFWEPFVLNPVNGKKQTNFDESYQCYMQCY